jgi:hypothetical protein
LGNVVPLTSDEKGNISLDFTFFLHPDIDSESQARNRSFALVVTTSQMLSFSASNDPWYYTKTANTSEHGAPYVVESGRPALSCWETTDICLGDVCYDSTLASSPLPEGLVQVFKTQFHVPASARIVLIS